jgi:protein-disulfide isomerase
VVQHQQHAQPPPGLAVPVGPDDHVRGPAEAPVTLVMYGDFECPYTRHAHTVIRAAQQRAGDRLRYLAPP